ncbi:hypothetical protein Geob_2805 [Geotalea daltonii FRC-32]|uniref:Uncharacterized protein n=1 Tax=Geotalea daltonii (strain DSM 22248 / JCM 15807 / FRC-32) TaxID=316067 RepID=B9M236_GEODF|nr:hypothetical protein Geob_2805 [Geotalea daltonii FRC-32]
MSGKAEAFLHYAVMDLITLIWVGCKFMSSTRDTDSDRYPENRSHA